MNTKQLKDKILAMAMRGELVEQDPTDESAEILLEKIKEEKAKLIAEKKIKKEKPLVPIEAEEIPYDMPQGWVWTRLGAIVEVKGGKRIPKGKTLTKEVTPYKYIRVTDMKNSTVLSEDTHYITEDIYNAISNYTISKDDLYITCAGTIGEVGIIPEEFDGANLTENADKLVFSYGHLEKNYILHLLKSDMIKQQINLSLTQVAQPKLAINKITNLLTPLPPLAEQKRIVEKIETLFAEVDKLEESRENLDRLKGKLDKKLLDMAMRGELVEQDPTDGSAEVLLKKIKEEKAKLIAEKKIKKEKPLAPIEEDEIPYDLPQGWVWTRLGELASHISKGTTPRGGNSAYTTEGIKFLRVENIKENFIFDFSDVKYIDAETNNTALKRSILEENDILITIAGTLGRATVVPKEILPINTNQAVSFTRLVNNKLVNARYIAYFIKSNTFVNSITKNTKTTSIPNLTLEMISRTLIPLPPLAEQKRIIEKLETVREIIKETL